MSDDLPMGWVKTELGEIFEFNPRHSSAIDKSMDVSFIPMPSVCEDNGIILPHNTKKLEEVWKGYTHFQNDDVIFAKITPCMENGKIALASNLHNDIACGSTEFHVLRSIGVVLPLYIWYFLRQKSFLRDAEQRMTGAVGQRRVPVNFLKETNLAIPPLNEQQRIVDKLDRLGDHHRTARNELSHIPKLIARYKQAVLEAVFLKISDSPRCTLGELTQLVTSGSRGWAKYYSDTGARFIRVGNVARENIALDLEDIQMVQPPKDSEGTRTRLQVNDILVTVTADLGRIGIIPADLGEAYINQHVALVRLMNQDLAKFVAWYLVSPSGQKQMLERNRGMTRAGLGLDDIRAVNIPLPSIIEQTTVIETIEKLFKAIDRIEQEHQKASVLLDRLEQTTLAKAFRGELVPQDPNDEPAAILLERIRRERPEQPKTKTGKSRRKPQTESL